MPHLLEDMQQLSDRSNGEGKRTQLVGVKLQIGRTHRYMAFHMRMEPDHTATAQVRFLSDTNQWKRTTTQGMAWVNNSDGLFGSKRHIDKGSELVEVCPIQGCRP
jgi:hypothetical protein